MDGVQQLAKAPAATTVDINAGPAPKSSLRCSAEDCAKSACFTTITISEVLASEPESALTSNTPVLSDETKQGLVLVAGIVAVIGLGVGLKSVTDSRKERHRREQQSLGDFDINPVSYFPLGSIGHWWASGSCNALELGQLTKQECQLLAKLAVSCC